MMLLNRNWALIENRLIDNLIYLRKREGWTQQRLANKTGIPRHTIQSQEDKKSKPQLSHMILFSELYNKSIDTLCRKNLWGDEGEESEAEMQESK